MNAALEHAYKANPPWLCAFTKARQEEFAALHLQRQGMEVFLPKLKYRRLLHGEVVWQIGPMFPRYLFLRTHESDAVARVRSTLGVVKLVAFGGKPAVVPEEVIEILRDHCKEGVCVAGEPAFKQGQKVKILAGPYAGMEAIFERETSQKERVIILLEIMASVARVKIDRNQLVAASLSD